MRVSHLTPVWSLFTAVYVPNSIFGVLMVLFFAMRASHIEKEVGTANFGWTFTLIHVLVQVTYFGIAFAVSYAFPMVWAMPSCGIWPMYFWIMTADAFRNPNQP